MGKVTTGATMSLDGFIADASHASFDYLFKWYGAGDVEGPGHRRDAGTDQVPSDQVRIR